MTRTVSNLRAVRVSAVGNRPIGYFVLVALLSVGLIASYTYFGPGADLALGVLLGFACLVFITENRDRIFGDETSISSSIVVAVASIVAFRTSASIIGATVCASFAGLYLPHLREKAISKIAMNASTIGLSACAAAICFDSLTASSPSTEEVLIASVPAVAVYWVVNTTLLSAAIALLGRAKFWRSASELLRSETPMLTLAVGGAGIGSIFSDQGSLIGFATLSAYLVLIDTCVIARRQWTQRLRLRWHFASVAVSAIAVSCLGYLAGQAGLWPALGIVVACVGVGAVVLAALRLHARTQHWDWGLARGVAIVEAPRWILFACVGVVAAVTNPWVGLAAFVGVCAALALGARLVQRRQRQLAEDDRRAALAVERAIFEGRSVPTAAR